MEVIVEGTVARLELRASVSLDLSFVTAPPHICNR